MKRKTNDEFINEVMVKHPNLIAIDEYKNSRTKILVKCKICGNEFSVTPSSLYMGHGCANCYGNKKYSNEEFIDMVKQLNRNVQVIDNYKGFSQHIKVRCKKCDYMWETIPAVLLRGCGCKKCAGTLKKTNDEFIIEMKEKHPDISVIGEYVNSTTDIECECLICRKHFQTKPKYMLQGTGCPFCSQSYGEKKICQWLSNNNIKYKQEYKFQDCRDKRPLPFDFYLPDFNICIEYDGKQHYYLNEYFGGESGFCAIQSHDRIKNEYCNEKGILLIRIPYFNYEDIGKILSEKIAI